MQVHIIENAYIQTYAIIISLICIIMSILSEFQLNGERLGELTFQKRMSVIICHYSKLSI